MSSLPFAFCRYIERSTPRETYFDDIKMQMVSKKYAKMYNALGPPKGVDFLLAFVIEVFARSLHFARP